MKEQLITVTLTREQWLAVSKALGWTVEQSQTCPPCNGECNQGRTCPNVVRGTQATPADSSMPGLETRKISLFLIPLRRVNSLLKRWLRRAND